MSPHLSDLARSQLIYVSIFMMINTMAELGQAEAAGIQKSTKRLYEHALTKLV